MELPVVVGVDGSEPSLHALGWAADEAARRGRSLRVVYASLWERYEGGALAREVGPAGGPVRAEDVVAAAARRATARQPDLKVTTEVVPEEAEYVLVRESRAASTVVVGHRGRGGLAEAVLGSVGPTVAAHAHCPLVVVRGDVDRDDVTRRPGRGRIVVGIGEEAETAAAVRFAAEEALLREVPLEAVRAWRRPAHGRAADASPAHAAGLTPEERAVRTLRAALREVPSGLEVRRGVVEGPARHALVDASRDAALLVVGVRHRGGHHGARLGRVAHGVLHHSACPVAVVPECA
ncbi:universal stress protein [Streptomyces sp. NPDC005931]|uniref:universal stress protein n=1 Tax=Streptomyces sp. NPDC005931 TaxID=3364737 RepID=UPI00368B07FB